MAARPLDAPKLIRAVWKDILDLPYGPSETRGACYVVDLETFVDSSHDGWIVVANRYTRRPDGGYLMKNSQWRDRRIYVDCRPVMFEPKGRAIEYLGGRMIALAKALFDPKPDGWRMFGRRGEKPFGRWGRKRSAKVMVSRGTDG